MRDDTVVPIGEGHLVLVRSSDDRSHRARCLLVGPFGLPARALQPLADAVAECGLDPVRFDGRDHPGAGSGTVADFRLSQLVDECVEVIVRCEPRAVLAISLGARAAVRALARTRSAAAAVLVTPIVDLRATLARVLTRDWFEVAPDDLPALMPVLDQEVRSVPFRNDCLDHALVGPDETAAELGATLGPVRVIAGSHDPWVDRTTLTSVVARSRHHREAPIDVRFVPADRHTFHEDPELTVRMVAAALAALRGLTPEAAV